MNRTYNLRYLCTTILGPALLVVATLGSPTKTTAGTFEAFESGQVRPIALSPSTNRLFVVNTPDNTLEIYAVISADLGGLIHVASVPVGMEPVAVAARNNKEVWVVNHLSDSVSIVDTRAKPPRVIRTLHVGDEPRDIVFAGTANKRAFITSAHRGQNSTAAFKPEATDIKRADVWVFDALNPGESMGGDPVTVINLFGEVPRALAVSNDKKTVYAATFLSGNQTTTIGRIATNSDIPPPLTNADGVPVPEQGMILKFDGSSWLDATGRDWSNRVQIALPDWDVFAIDADASPPVETNKFPGVGSTLFNMVVNPGNDKLYISNLEARNHIRFEGSGNFGGSTLRGHIAENRISILDGTTLNFRHLNKHIDYSEFPGTALENANSLAFPLDMAITADGSTLYVAAYGSSKIGVYKTSELENDSFTPDQSSQIAVNGGGPSGIALDEQRRLLYVLTRFDNSISIIDLDTKTKLRHLAMHNPEPQSLIEGRRFLYDAAYTSSRGDSACASCHIFGDLDALAWNLGNPDGSVVENPNPFRRIFPPGQDISFHPMKGPMTTQSLRGMANQGPMHWRGDRTGGSKPGGDPFDEEAAFKAFNVAFEGLLGRTSPLTDTEMQAFTDFTLQLVYPPNPIRSLDNSLTASQARGQDFFFNFPTELDGSTCNRCHVVNPEAGFFGTDGQSTARPGEQPFKIPHLRNIYAKGHILSHGPLNKNRTRGIGFLHDGAISDLISLLNGPGFDFPDGNPQRLDVANFVMAIDSNLAPVVGQQVTLTSSNRSAVINRINLLEQRAAIQPPSPECDLIVKGVMNGESRGWLRANNGLYVSDRQNDTPLLKPQLLKIVRGSDQTLTFTCAPPGSGMRMGIDRDEDGFFDRDELDAGSDPSDPASTPNI